MILNGSLILHKPVRSLNKSPCSQGLKYLGSRQLWQCSHPSMKPRATKEASAGACPPSAACKLRQSLRGRLSLSYRQVCAYLCLVLYHSNSDPGLTWDLLHHYGLLWWSGLLAGHYLIYSSLSTTGTLWPCWWAHCFCLSCCDSLLLPYILLWSSNLSHVYDYSCCFIFSNRIRK